jgi:hypothetical protein
MYLAVNYPYAILFNTTALFKFMFILKKNNYLLH